MNPNKKILNPKNNSPWLLCPSKSCPGKFYYFNGSTGETAWCLSETDRNLKKGPIHRVTDKTHTYPEPFDPPIDDSTNTTNSFIFQQTPSNAGNIKFRNAKEISPSPVFGQGFFPKYVSPDIFTPNFVWALTPMYAQSQHPITQTYDQPIFGPNSVPNHFQLQSNFTPNGFQFQKQPFQSRERPMFETAPRTQTYDQPIIGPNSVPNHFQLQSNFTPNGFQFQKQPFQSRERPMFETANLSSFKLSKEAQTLAKPFMKDEACQTVVPARTKRIKTRSESDSTPKSVLKASRSVENLSTLFTKDVETSTPSPPQKVDNETGKMSELAKNDLRFKLLAKKRKVKCTTETEKAGKSTDQSTSKTREVLPPRKRVTFDIQDSGASNASSQDVQETDQSPESSRVEELIQPTHDGPLFVVADTAVLLADMQCVEEFVKSDALCRLLIPHAVYTELTQRSHGDSGTLPARRLLRKLAVQNSHIIVQSKPENELSLEDSLLECCWTLLQEDCHVVLISNDTKLLNEAKSIDLECYTLDEIKSYNEADAEPQKDLKKVKINVGNDKNISKNLSYNEADAEPQNDLKKVKINVGNDKNISKNLFMQNLSQLNGLCLPKTNGFKISDARKSIFDAELNSSSEFYKRDDNKLINLTKPHSKVNTVFSSEISNVKDQIVKLSIADSRPVSNRTKGIMKNVFSTTGLDNNIDRDKSVDIENNCNQNQELSKLYNNNQNQRDVKKNLTVIDKIDLDVRKLNMSDKKKSRDTIKISGITKLNNQFNLDEDLERFYVKNRMVEQRIKSRLEEWSCRLNQTMEGVLTEILLKEKIKMKRMMPPWNLFEAIQVTGEAFKKQPEIKTIINRFSMKLLNCSSNNGKLNNDIKPVDFMKLVGLSMILIDHLKEVVNCKELLEADDMIVDLIKNIEDPKTDIDLTLEKVNTPIFSRSEMLEDKAPVGFRKSRTDIEEHLKKHYAAWQTHEADSLTDKVVKDNKDKTVNKEPKIVRTCGKDLSTLKISNTKAITVENKAGKAYTKVITVENKADKSDVTNQPKVIRNVTIIPAFEDRLKKKEVDLDELDYDENETVYTMLSDENVQVYDEDDKNNLPDNSNILDDLSVSDRSVNTECAGAYPLVKIFLVKLKSTLVKIFDFINKSIREYQEGMSMDKRTNMLLKIEVTRQYVLKITERLKNIIARESGNEMTLKDILIKAGDYVEDDPVITNYKQTVKKYLEQTQILEEVLERMLSLSKSVSVKEKEESYSESQNTSPILPTRGLRRS